MKFLILLFLAVVFSSLTTYAAVITCDSDAESVKRANLKLRVQFEVLSDTELKDVEIFLADEKSVYHHVIKRKNTVADDRGKRTDPLNRFDVSEDVTDAYELRLPLNIPAEKQFKGYIYVSFEHGRPSRVGVDCNQ